MASPVRPFEGPNSARYRQLSDVQLVRDFNSQRKKDMVSPNQSNQNVLETDRSLDGTGTPAQPGATLYQLTGPLTASIPPHFVVPISQEGHFPVSTPDDMRSSPRWLLRGIWFVSADITLGSYVLGGTWKTTSVISPRFAQHLLSPKAG